MDLWIDGEKISDPNLVKWNKVSTLVIPSSTRIIATTCFSAGIVFGGGYGLTASVTDSDGEDVLVTDESWKCSSSDEEGWQKFTFKEGDNWKPASSHDNKGLMGATGDMSPDRKVIWVKSGFNKSNTAYCRKVIGPRGKLEY